MKCEKVRLGDVAKVSSSKRIFASQYTKSGVPFYRQKEIIDKKNKNEIINPLFISWETFDDIKKKFGAPNKNDLLITAVGVTLGIPYVVVDEIFYFKDGNLIWLSNFDENIHSKYLYYWINSDIGQKIIWSRTIGSAQPALTIDILKQLEIPVPIFNTQCKIVKILSAYDDLIENNQKQIKLLEEAAQRLYKEWFVDFRFPGYEDTKFIDGIPDGWRKQKISDFGEIKTGKTPSTTKESYYGGHIPFVKIPDMHNRIYPIATETTLTSEGANTQKNQFIPKNSIMVSCIGTVGLVNISIELCQTNQQINSIMPNDEKDLYYIYSTMKRLKTLLEGVGSNGATMTNVNKTKFGNLEVLYPNYDLRDKYFNNCKVIFEKIFSLSVGIEKLTQARDRLLPKLMSGEIEV